MRRLHCIVLGALLAATGASLASGAEEPVTQLQADAEVLTGTLAAQQDHQLVLRDAHGADHALALTDETRFVWSERTAPRDLRPGAQIRAELIRGVRGLTAAAVWVLAPPP